MKCVPEPIYLTVREEEEDRQKESDDTVRGMYVQKKKITGGENELETQQQIGHYYIGQYAYIGQ